MECHGVTGAGVIAITPTKSNTVAEICEGLAGGLIQYSTGEDKHYEELLNQNLVECGGREPWNEGGTRGMLEWTKSNWNDHADTEIVKLREVHPSISEMIEREYDKIHSYFKDKRKEPLSSDKSLTVRQVAQYLGHRTGSYQAERKIGMFAPATDGGPGHYGNERQRKLRVGACYAPATDGGPGHYGNERKRDKRIEAGEELVPMFSPACPVGKVRNILVDKNHSYTSIQRCDHCERNHGNFIPKDPATRERFGILEIPGTYGPRPKWEDRYVSNL
jgi:hypothetical protein